MMQKSRRKRRGRRSAVSKSKKRKKKSQKAKALRSMMTSKVREKRCTWSRMEKSLMSDTIVDVDRMRAATRKELKMRKKRLLYVLKRLNKHTSFFFFFSCFFFFSPLSHSFFGNLPTGITESIPLALTSGRMAMK